MRKRISSVRKLQSANGKLDEVKGFLLTNGFDIKRYLQTVMSITEIPVTNNEQALKNYYAFSWKEKS